MSKNKINLSQTTEVEQCNTMGAYALISTIGNTDTVSIGHKRHKFSAFSKEPMRALGKQKMKYDVYQKTVK